MASQAAPALAPVFIDMSLDAQVSELRQFLLSKGASLGEESRGASRVYDDLAQVIEHCQVTFSEATSTADAEAVMNSIVCLLLILPGEYSPKLLQAFCSKLDAIDSPSFHQTCLRVLMNLFSGLPECSELRYVAFCSIVKFAGKTGDICAIPTDVNQIKQWCLGQWKLSVNEYQILLRTLHDAFLSNKETKRASEVMVTLLGTYTSDTASLASDDAHRCIVTSLGDPSMYLLDHLLALKPVQLLSKEKSYQLLSIFVGGKLSEYLDFYEKNEQYINDLGLSHDQNVDKMRVLNFMLLAEENKLVTFDTIEKELRVPKKDIEQFVIDVIQTGVLYARVHQSSETVSIGSTCQRSLECSQWAELRDLLAHWDMELSKVHGSLGEVSTSGAGPEGLHAYGQ